MCILIFILTIEGKITETDFKWQTSYTILRGNFEIDLNKETIIFWQSTYLKKTVEKNKMSNLRPEEIFISLIVANFLIAYKNQAERDTLAWCWSILGIII